MLKARKQHGIMKRTLAILCVLPALAQDVPSSRELALGAGLAAEIRQQSPTLDNERVQKYVAELGAALAAPLANPPFPYKFEVVVSSDREPASLPGGYVMVPDAALREAGSEREVAAMLAHAIAHVHLRHGSKPVAVQAASVPLIFMGGWKGVHRRTSDSLLVPAIFQEAQRTYEIEADELGQQLTASTPLLNRPAAGFNAVREELRRLRPEKKPPTLYRPGPR